MTKVYDLSQKRAEKSALDDPPELSLQVTWTQGSYTLTVTDYTTTEDPGVEGLQDVVGRLRFVIERLEAEIHRREQEPT